MKGRSNGGGSNLVYGTAIAIAMCVAILFGCLAMTAQAGRSPHQLLSKVGRRTTRALYLASSGSNTTSAYHTEDNCFEALDDETKTKLITLIFCTAKCYCHSDRKEDVCYCCQPEQGCYDTLQECQAKCPVCNPTCPDGTTADGQQLHGTKNATLIN
ncbi:unnamed protein product [Miscanthus lutarioriparius]|uniref:Uncharacterized protein n=1 Tax=Miscanthus lutarioriparius TaxID=422564 RepID=A0A811SFH2_9POAL|nr:unnamed protein product [Miscanthus lutarioriparius]